MIRFEMYSLIYVHFGIEKIINIEFMSFWEDGNLLAKLVGENYKEGKKSK
jgi:hypothetical protein